MRPNVLPHPPGSRVVKILALRSRNSGEHLHVKAMISVYFSASTCGVDAIISYELKGRRSKSRREHVPVCLCCRRGMYGLLSADHHKNNRIQDMPPGLSSPTFSLDISPIYFPRTFPRHSPRYPHLSPDISPDIFRTPQTFPRISLGHPPPFAGHFPGRSPRHPRTFPGALSPRHSPDILGHFPGHCLVDINPDILRTFPRTFRPGISPGYFPRHFFWTHHPDIPRHSLDISADILSQKFYPRRFLGPGLFCPDIPRTVFSDVSP